MKIQEVIAAINQMQADGVIGKYAIGGAVGARFYLEQEAVEQKKLSGILDQHGLTPKWKQFERKFMRGLR